LLSGVSVALPNSKPMLSSRMLLPTAGGSTRGKGTSLVLAWSATTTLGGGGTLGLGPGAQGGVGRRHAQVHVVNEVVRPAFPLRKPLVLRGLITVEVADQQPAFASLGLDHPAYALPAVGREHLLFIHPAA
jgi:hypothetical protein